MTMNCRTQLPTAVGTPSTVCEQIHESDDQKYGNCTSIMFYFRHGRHSILFPADMTPEGMEHLLEEKEGSQKRYTKFDSDFTSKHPQWHEKTFGQPSLYSLLQLHGLTVLVAPHHGLESCYSTELYDAIKGGRPDFVVLSEKRHLSDTDGSVDSRYQNKNGASGLTVDIEGKQEKGRISLSTINGHHILILFDGTGRPKVYAEKDPLKLLKGLEA